MFRRFLSVLIALAIAFAASGHALATAYAPADIGDGGHVTKVRSGEFAAPSGGHASHDTEPRAAGNPVDCCLDDNGRWGVGHSCSFNARVEAPDEIDTHRVVAATRYWQEIVRMDGRAPAALPRPPEEAA